MKIHHPGGIVVIVVIVLISIGATLFVEARTRNPNPAIEWVLIQLAPKTPGNSNIQISIQGYNFTPTNNEVRTRGKVLKGGLTAVQGLAVYDPDSPVAQRFFGLESYVIKFQLPEGIPCSSGEACPISVVNANGVSNTVYFNLY